MGTVERVALAVVGVAFVTTLILPDRQTAKVLQTAFAGANASLRTAMGR